MSVVKQKGLFSSCYHFLLISIFFISFCFVCKIYLFQTEWFLKKIGTLRT